MSDTAMDTPDSTTHTRGATSRVAKPDLYYGDRAKLEKWLMQFDVYFKIEDENIDDDDRPLLVVSYLRGRAEEWVAPYLRKYMDSDNNEESVTRMFQDWDEFKEKLRQTFSVANETNDAERAIQSLRQTKSAGDYANKFQHYAIQTEWNDKALMRMYRQGLKSQVRIELMRSGATVATLDDLINESIRLDNELYEHEKETQAFTAPRGQPRKETGRYKNNRQPRKGVYVPRTPGYYQNNRPEAMHVDNIDHGRTGNASHNKSSGKIGNIDNKKNSTCYNCGKKGHFSRDCRSKNKVTRQINMIVTDDQDEEWEVTTPETQESPTISPPDITEAYEQIPIMTRQLMTTLYQRFINRPGPLGALSRSTWPTEQQFGKFLIQRGLDQQEQGIPWPNTAEKTIYEQLHHLSHPSKEAEEPGMGPDSPASEGSETSSLYIHECAQKERASEQLIGQLYEYCKEEITPLQALAQETWPTQQSFQGFLQRNLLHVKKGEDEPWIQANREIIHGYLQRLGNDINSSPGHTDTDSEEEAKLYPEDPHPGRRITEWENQESDKENQDPEAAAYWIDNGGIKHFTPPDSPTLKREDATLGNTQWCKPHNEARCKKEQDPSTKEWWKANTSRKRKAPRIEYANEGQALLVEDEGRMRQKADRLSAEEYIKAQRPTVQVQTPEGISWVDLEIYNNRRYGTPMVVDTPLANTPRYDFDHRNMLHGLLSWTACYYDECDTHYHDKNGTGYWPTRHSRCKWQWYDCTKDGCERHLWDKRQAQHFPSSEQQDQDLVYDANRILINGRCPGPMWQTCLQEACTKHKEAKQLNGFLPRESEDESFLDELCLSDGSENAMPSPLKASSNSQ